MDKICFFNENNIYVIKYNDDELKFIIDDKETVITEINALNYLQNLLEYLICYVYNKCGKIVYEGSVNLEKHHFDKSDSGFILDLNKVKIRRFVKIGKMSTGKKNNICDVEGVLVGQKSIKTDKYNTGVTVVKPHPGNIFKEKVVAASHVHNGFGKSMGFVQIDELGTIETPIAITGTLNIGIIADAVIEKSLEENPEIGISTGTVNPIVLECNDSTLNDSRDRYITKDDYFEAYSNLNDDFSQGAVGGGCGMVCHGFKGGIGSSSRIIKIGDNEYTLAVLVNSNFGSGNGQDLIFNGKRLGDEIKTLQDFEDKGSITVLVVTDLPLDNRQLKRVVKRCSMGISRTGSFAGHGSGDVFVGLSTANKIKHFSDDAFENVIRMRDGYINSVFRACVEATEEAVLNSMLFSEKTSGRRNVIFGLNKYYQTYIEKITPVIEYLK